MGMGYRRVRPGKKNVQFISVIGKFFCIQGSGAQLNGGIASVCDFYAVFIENEQIYDIYGNHSHLEISNYINVCAIIIICFDL